MRIAILSVLVIFMNCGSTKNTATPHEINELKETLNNKEIEITFNWARPLGLNNNVRGIENLLPPGSTASNINLVGNSNFFRIKRDSLHIDLPYYGQQQMARGYNSESGIKFEGVPDKNNKVFDVKKRAYILKYSFNDKNDNYNAILTLFVNKRSDLRINSSNRTAISYSGNWQERILEKK
ncbi:DUF4251 domain-containing protein [Polaribacter cellanae]|uniref:DUF4251 domain-containing protein n=1 Tax=Polaribacter cellanae TaxID=2818493 RepID=A0A975H758_9FLAO|nr:DUF4251 domain-containing protein [Polaribacter cellanae]QTE23132.1 DUF4251 domain-containing protein [Polaribacter cellanae]